MVFFFLILVLLCLVGMRYDKKRITEYLSLSNTQSIKGFFIILVFFSHFNSYVLFDSSLDLIYTKIIGWFGQTMVTLFLFYSGYGIMESVKKRGQNYIKSIPQNRILKTLIKFDCAVFLYLIIGIIFGQSFGLFNILLSFLGWSSLGNSNWYIFVILGLYLITYISFCLFRQKPYWCSVLMIFFMVVFCIIINILLDLKPLYWYDTALCYVLGMFYSLYRLKIEKIVNANYVTYIISIVFLMVIVCFLKLYGSISFFSILLNLVFSLLIIFLTIRVHIGNKILNWCGKNLFELYILQRIPMIILKNIGLADFNVYIYFVSCLIATILLVFPFKLFTNKIWDIIQNIFFRSKQQSLVRKKKV